MTVNLLFIRYFMIVKDHGFDEFIVLQFPWWNAQRAFFRGKTLYHKEHKIR